MRYITLGITLVTGLAPFVAAKDYPRDGDDWVYWDDFIDSVKGPEQIEASQKQLALGAFWDATKANNFDAAKAHDGDGKCALVFYFDDMQMRKKSYDAVEKELNDLGVTGEIRKQTQIDLGMDSYMKAMAVAPVCGWDAVDYPRSGDNGESSVVFHNRNEMYLKGDVYLVLSDLDKDNATKDTVNLDAFGGASIQFAEGADKKVEELWKDIKLTPGLFRGWAQHALLSLAKANQMTEEGARVLKYPNPYHVPRYSTTWETYNALSTRKQEDMVPVE